MPSLIHSMNRKRMKYFHLLNAFLYTIIWWIFYLQKEVTLKKKKKKRKRKEKVNVFPQQNRKGWIYFALFRGGVIGTIFIFIWSKVLKAPWMLLSLDPALMVYLEKSYWMLTERGQIPISVCTRALWSDIRDCNRRSLQIKDGPMDSL